MLVFSNLVVIPGCGIYSYYTYEQDAENERRKIAKQEAKNKVINAEYKEIQKSRKEYCLALPSSPFTDNRDGTVTDSNTGLMWKKCSEGQSGTNCSEGNAKTSKWNVASKQAQTLNNMGGFAGYKDWRIPSVEELTSIVEKNSNCIEPAIKLSIFPNTPSDIFLSSTPFTESRDVAWVVHFAVGGKTAYNKDYLFNVRLVRGGIGK